MIHLLILACNAIGFASLCAAMPRHQRTMTGRTLTAIQARNARISGWSGLAVALSLAMAFFGPAYGAVLWTGHLTMGAVLAVAMLSLRRCLAK